MAAGQGSEDMLLVLANQYLEQKKEPEKVHTLFGEDRADDGAEGRSRKG